MLFMVSLIVFAIALLCAFLAVRAGKGSYTRRVMLISLWFCVAAMLYCTYQIGITAGIFH
jgi:hypothetical protein